MQLEGKPVLNYVLLRTAVVLVTKDLHYDTETDSFSGPGEILSCGSAAAIDKRGYFVTASHCVDENDTFLTFPLSDKKNGEIATMKARVVWRGALANDPEQQENDQSYDLNVFANDLAVLHVDPELPCSFTMSSKPATKKQTVISAGATEKANGNSDSISHVVQTYGGTITDLETVNSAGKDTNFIVHQSPAIGGNSGGPLVNLAGELIGIHVASRNTKNWNGGKKKQSLAVRPDLDWIKKVIERDFTRLSTKTESGE